MLIGSVVGVSAWRTSERVFSWRAWCVLPAGLLLVVAGCMVSLSKSDPVLLRPEGTLEADFQGSVKKNVIRDSKVIFLLCIQISDVCQQQFCGCLGEAQMSSVKWNSVGSLHIVALSKNPHSLYNTFQPRLYDLFMGGAALKMMFSIHPGGAKVSSQFVLPSNGVLILESTLE